MIHNQNNLILSLSKSFSAELPVGYPVPDEVVSMERNDGFLKDGMVIVNLGDDDDGFPDMDTLDKELMDDLNA